ncbi:MAG: VOC family protein [Desulfuromonadaceae bacterium]|nr:VOC family protein [Desulfuromonadaceae bacterium]
MKYDMIHICIRVMDLKKSEQFYQQAFGFEISRRKDFPDHKFTLSYLRSPGGHFELELTWNHDQTEPYELGNGYSHLAVGVKDLETSHQQHEAHGFNPKPLKGLAGGAPKFYFLADPDGYLVEVVRS